MPETKKVKEKHHRTQSVDRSRDTNSKKIKERSQSASSSRSKKNKEAKCENEARFAPSHTPKVRDGKFVDGTAAKRDPSKRERGSKQINILTKRELAEAMEKAIVQHAQSCIIGK